MPSQQPEQQQSSDRHNAPLQHWSTYGQRGNIPEDRILATDWQTKNFMEPRDAGWKVRIEPYQLPMLIMGFRPFARRHSDALPRQDLLQEGETIATRWSTSTSEESNAQVSDDKWFVYVDGPNPAGQLVLHMYQSWTGLKMYEVYVDASASFQQEDKDGDVWITALRWETSPSLVENSSEQLSKDGVREVCSWILNVQLSEDS